MPDSELWLQDATKSTAPTTDSGLREQAGVSDTSPLPTSTRCCSFTSKSTAPLSMDLREEELQANGSAQEQHLHPRGGIKERGHRGWDHWGRGHTVGRDHQVSEGRAHPCQLRSWTSAPFAESVKRSCVAGGEAPLGFFPSQVARACSLT